MSDSSPRSARHPRLPFSGTGQCGGSAAGRLLRQRLRCRAGLSPIVIRHGFPGSGDLRDRCRVPVETGSSHRAGITVAASPMAAFVPVGVAVAEVGDDETVTLLFARNDRPERPSIGRLCVCPAPRIATMSLVAGSAASGRIGRESPPSFRDEQAAHSPLFGQSQSGAVSRETASMTASLLVVRSGAVVALNSGFSVAQALAIDWTRTRIAVASHRSVNLPSL
jgi:hypothetical protein